MARTPYTFEKRKKELDRKKKQEEKLLKKQKAPESADDTGENEEADAAPDEPTE